MSILSSQVEKLARTGANIEISADAGYLASQIERIIRIVVANNSHITIHAGKYLASQLETFGRIGGKNITIVV
ncbi:hypothetical protein DX883_12835 [Vibrio fluvialis]|nr:hypothetical protein [Vibrio fluvialis]EKO3996656.1 hypothetical protein [Vibrio fluvialis]